jgi:hypothetical protein
MRSYASKSKTPNNTPQKSSAVTSTMPTPLKIVLSMQRALLSDKLLTEVKCNHVYSLHDITSQESDMRTFPMAFYNNVLHYFDNLIFDQVITIHQPITKETVYNLHYSVNCHLTESESSISKGLRSGSPMSCQYIIKVKFPIEFVNSKMAYAKILISVLIDDNWISFGITSREFYVDYSVFYYTTLCYTIYYIVC